jgi:hypothetical protein
VFTLGLILTVRRSSQAPHSTGSTGDRSTDEHASGATMTTGRDVVEARFTV